MHECNIIMQLTQPHIGANFPSQNLGTKHGPERLAAEGGKFWRIHKAHDSDLISCLYMCGGGECVCVCVHCVCVYMRARACVCVIQYFCHASNSVQWDTML